MNLYPLLVLLFAAFIYQFIQWRLRIHKWRLLVPATGALVGQFHVVRRFIPSKYQRFHYDWPFHHSSQHKSLSSAYANRDIFVIVPLFGVDIVYVANAEAINEILSNPGRFPKNLEQYG